MELLEKILNSSKEEIDFIITSEIEKLNSFATKINRLGFLDYGKSNYIFKGFIPLDTRIKYSAMNIEDYSMDTKDFFYEFATFIKKYNITSKGQLIYFLETFINMYFGLKGSHNREEIFNDLAWKSTTTDEEYFEALKNNKIGDLKGKNVAECTERAALANQILSLFGVESYYTMGCFSMKDKEEGHCFNILRKKNGYAIVDYSVPVCIYDSTDKLKGFYPFVADLTTLEFEDFIRNQTIKSFDNYYFKGKDRVLDGESRKYVVGTYQIKKEEETLKK